MNAVAPWDAQCIPPVALLVRHVQFQTWDLRRAEAEGARTMSPHRLEIARSADRFHSHMRAAEVGSSALVFLDVVGPLQLAATAPMNYYTAQLVLRGGFDVVTERGAASVGPGGACVLSPGQRLEIHFGTRTT